MPAGSGGHSRSVSKKSVLHCAQIYARFLEKVVLILKGVTNYFRLGGLTEVFHSTGFGANGGAAGRSAVRRA